MSNQQIPIVCDMNALPDRAHHEQIGAELMPQAQAVNELDDGYRIDFPITALKLVADFVDGELRCCPFIQFSIIVEPAAEVAQLSLSGSLEIKAFMKQELLPHLPAPSKN